ncbi:LysR family transcriptional regulator [Bdellovibrio sp. HCB290]|uniref:LysR family transcriptional regulator n=1 Tax=Bdellovibrio sp. HCB290 TaxID=3394356 RepID=UPI0039B3FBE5
MSADYETLKYFNKVAETLSFVQAANDLNIQKSLLSRKIAELESQMGVRLFHRTTRKVTLTEEGMAFLQEVHDGVKIFEQAIESIQSTRSAPQGTVRISTPIEFGLYLLEHVMPGFFETYPLVKIEWDFSGEQRNLAQHRLDLVIRAGHPKEEALIARKIGPVHFYAYISPSLSIQKRRKLDAEILEQLPWITFHRQAIKPGRDPLKVAINGEEILFTPKNNAPYKANNLSAIKTMILQGNGIGFLPDFLFRKEIEEGKLVELQPRIEWMTETELYLVYPSKSFIPPKTKVLSDWIISKSNLGR